MTPLRKRMLEDMQLRGLSEGTQKVYISVVRDLANYYNKSPDQISDEQLRLYFLYLKDEKKLARSTCTVAISGIKFLFDYTLKRGWPGKVSGTRPRQRRRDKSWAAEMLELNLKLHIFGHARCWRRSR